MEQIDKNIFDPSTLSFPDCDFILAHAGEAPIVAARSGGSVTAAQWIARIYELEELKKAGGVPWAGIEAVKASIQTYLDVRESWRKDQTHGGPKFPSLYSFDSRGNGHLGAPGSDSTRIKTYFDEHGNRKEFAIALIDEAAKGVWRPKWAGKSQEASPSTSLTPIIEPEGKNCLECGVPGCGHTETFRPESRASRNAARARLSKHMRKALFEPEVHMEAYSLEFGAPSI